MIRFSQHLAVLGFNSKSLEIQDCGKMIFAFTSCHDSRKKRTFTRKYAFTLCTFLAVTLSAIKFVTCTLQLRSQSRKGALTVLVFRYKIRFIFVSYIYFCFIFWILHLFTFYIYSLQCEVVDWNRSTCARSVSVYFKFDQISDKSPSYLRITSKMTRTKLVPPHYSEWG